MSTQISSMLIVHQGHIFKISNHFKLKKPFGEKVKHLHLFTESSCSLRPSFGLRKIVSFTTFTSPR